MLRRVRSIVRRATPGCRGVIPRRLTEMMMDGLLGSDLVVSVVMAGFLDRITVDFAVVVTVVCIFRINDIIGRELWRCDCC